MEEMEKMVVQVEMERGEHQARLVSQELMACLDKQVCQVHVAPRAKVEFRDMMELEEQQE